jgi:hypothetical protein
MVPTLAVMLSEAKHHWLVSEPENKQSEILGFAQNDMAPVTILIFYRR